MRFLATLFAMCMALPRVVAAQPSPDDEPAEHFRTIVNRGNQPITVPMQTTLAFESHCPAGHRIEQWSVEKGGPAPTDVGVHRETITPGFHSKIVSHGTAIDQPRECIPWTCIYDTDAREGWFAGIESSGTVQIELRMNDGVLSANLGLPDGQTRIMPGETFETPRVFVGGFRGDVDDAANRMRKWVRQHLAPKVKDERFPLLVNNTWGSGMNIDEKLCRKMIDESANLGLEMFHIDAGWYRTVGDWRAHETKFQNGLAPIADYAHSKNLKFGLWVAWSHGGDADVRDPGKKDWFTRDYSTDWHASDFAGAPMCLAKPQAADSCLEMLPKLVREAKLDLLEHDQVMVLDDCKRTDHPHTSSPSDIAYHAARGYCRVYDALKKEFPDLLLEDCVNGGHMIDYGVIQRWWDPLESTCRHASLSIL